MEPYDTNDGRKCGDGRHCIALDSTPMPGGRLVARTSLGYLLQRESMRVVKSRIRVVRLSLSSKKPRFQKLEWASKLQLHYSSYM